MNTLPALNSTIAFKQANSAGSTWMVLKRNRTSARILTSDAEWPFLTCSLTLNRGLAETSIGIHH